MSKYTVGDVVRMRADLENWVDYGAVLYIDSMYRPEVKISKVIDVEGSYVYNVTELDGTAFAGGYHYSEEMFEGLASEPEPEPSFRVDESLNVVFIRVGPMTVCVPLEAPIGIATKSPKDEECIEIGEALSYQRMILQSVAKEDK